MQKEMIVNKIPAKTWYRLNMNDATVLWDQDNTYSLSQESIETKENETKEVVITVEDDSSSSEHSYSSKNITITAGKASKITAYVMMKVHQNMAINLNLNTEEDATIKLVEVQLADSDAVIVNNIKGTCSEQSAIEVVHFFMGRGQIFSDSQIDLLGKKSRAAFDVGYIGNSPVADKAGAKGDNIDINILINHIGKKTESDINVNGALKDGATKTFRGTIDFKTGSSDSVGNEQETVILLGEDVINKTIPIILCAEENVVGNHGGSIGELDDDLLFYFESRGIGREEAENIMARASIERVLRLVDNESVREEITNKLEEIL